MRRWISRILLTLCGLVLVVIVAVQAILFTDLPKRLILEYINKEFGLKVTARSLRTSLWGKTTIKDFALSLPDEKDSLLVIPEMNISHTAPALIPFGGSFTLYDARIVNPTVNIKEVQSGRWNIQKFANHIQQVTAGRKDRQAFSLPELDIVDGLIAITDYNSHIKKLGDIFFQGKPQKQYTWNFEMNIASLIKASGSFAQNRRKQINLSFTTDGKSALLNWHGQARLAGSGNTWLNSQWQIDISRLDCLWQNFNITSSDIKAAIAIDWPNIRLVSLDSASVEQLETTGEFSAETRNWRISVDAEGIKANKNQSSPIDLRVVAGGSPNNVTVSQFRMAYKDLQIEAAGDVALPSGQLYNAHADASLLTHPLKAGERNLADVSGDIKCETIITGTILPVNLQLKSVLFGSDIAFKNKAVGSVRIPWQAEIDTKLLKYKTEQFQLFDGTWNLQGQYDLSKHSLESALHTNTVSLKSIIELFDIPLDCRGQITTNLEAQLPVNDLNQAVISGNWNINDLKIPPLEADNAKGLIDIQNGIARFEQIHLNRSEGLISADASFQLTQPQNISIDLESQKWPLYVPDYKMTLVTDAKGSASVNISNRTMKGKWQMSTSVAIDDNNLAVASANVAVDSSTVDLDNIKISAFGGLADGTATIPFENWTNSNAAIQWRDIDMRMFARCWPKLKGFAGQLLPDLVGKVSGSLNVTQAQGKLPLEPVQLEVNGEISEGNWRNAKISGYRISAYLGKKRLLIDKAELKAMDGIIKLAGSVTEHSGSFSTYVNADFSQLELNQLVHLFLPTSKTVIGRLTGKGMLVILSDLHGMTGEVNISLSESDLASTLIVSTLYDTMNLKLGKNEPTGKGQIKLRFEGSAIEIPSFVYFNRGVDLRGGGTIDDITQGGKSTIRGYAAGSARPFKNISLPGIDELDKLMTSLQNDVSSVQIRGTLAEPKVTVVPFQEISGSLRTLLWRQLLDRDKGTAH